MTDQSKMPEEIGTILAKLENWLAVEDPTAIRIRDRVVELLRAERNRTEALENIYEMTSYADMNRDIEEIARETLKSLSDVEKEA